MKKNGFQSKVSDKQGIVDRDDRPHLTEGFGVGTHGDLLLHLLSGEQGGGGGGLETGEGESEIVITSWLLVPLLEVTTLGLSGGGQCCLPAE